MGHTSYDCTSAPNPNAKGAKGKGKGKGKGKAAYLATLECYNCGGEGHASKDCSSGKKCDECSGFGHVQRDCPNNQVDWAHERAAYYGYDLKGGKAKSGGKGYVRQT